MNGQVERYKIQINNLNDKVGELEVQLIQSKKVKNKDQMKSENQKLVGQLDY